MNSDINEYLNSNYNKIYKLDNLFIDNLFLELRNYLKTIKYKNYNLKKKYIVECIYKYFKNVLEIDERVLEISKRKQPVQRSQEWYDMRYNIISASDAGTVIGTKFEHISDSENAKIKPHAAFKTKKDLIKTKVLREDNFKGNKYTKHGQIFEEVANLIYQKKNNNFVIEFGLVQHPSIKFLGASPDGITRNGIMIEIKSPYSRKVNGIVPSNYWVQMQLQLEVCNLEICHFVEIEASFYESEYDYNNDLTFNKDDNEKGFVIKCFNNNSEEYKYVYPDINIFDNSELLNIWKNNTIKNYNNLFDNVEVCYWKVNKYSCVEINRDKNWFDKNLYKFEDFYKEIVYYKNNINLLEKNMPTQKKKNKVLIMSDSDEEDNLNLKKQKNDKIDNNSESVKTNSININNDIDINLIVNDL